RRRRPAEALGAARAGTGEPAGDAARLHDDRAGVLPVPGRHAAVTPPGGPGPARRLGRQRLPLPAPARGAAPGRRGPLPVGRARRRPLLAAGATGRLRRYAGGGRLPAADRRRGPVVPARAGLVHGRRRCRLLRAAAGARDRAPRGGQGDQPARRLPAEPGAAGAGDRVPGAARACAEQVLRAPAAALTAARAFSRYIRARSVPHEVEPSAPRSGPMPIPQSPDATTGAAPPADPRPLTLVQRAWLLDEIQLWRARGLVSGE